MGRDIKYRVKVTWRDSVWLANVDYMKSDGFGGWYGLAFININNWESAQVEFHTDADDVLMQYTGLKDKNGVEIYEGDVVSFMFLKTKVERKRGVVVFDVDELCYFIRTSSEWGYNHNLAWCEMEVIGNIYENPELLEAINEQGND